MSFTGYVCLRRKGIKVGWEDNMFESVKLQKFALATSVIKPRSGVVFVRLQMVRTCHANTVYELNMK